MISAQGRTVFQIISKLSKIASITAYHPFKLGESPSPSYSDSDRPEDEDDYYLQRQQLLSYRGLQEKMTLSPDYGSPFHQRLAGAYGVSSPADLSKRSPPRETSRSSAVPSSLFTIDSILAPRPATTTSSSTSCLSPAMTSRLPTPALLRHPLHFGHLAAVASGFSPSSSDFLGT